MSSGPSSTRPRETSTAQAKVPQRPRVGSIARVKLNPSLVTKVDQDMWLFKDGGAGLLNNDSDDFRFEV